MIHSQRRGFQIVLMAIALPLLALLGCNSQNMESKDAKKAAAGTPSKDQDSGNPDDKYSDSQEPGRGYRKANKPVPVTGSWLTCAPTGTSENGFGCGAYPVKGQKMQDPITSWEVKVSSIDNIKQYTVLQSQMVAMPQEHVWHVAFEVPGGLASSQFILEAKISVGGKDMFDQITYDPARGTNVAGFKWFLGDQNQNSCNEICGKKGLSCDLQGIQDFAGSKETPAFVSSTSIDEIIRGSAGKQTQRDRHCEGVLYALRRFVSPSASEAFYRNGGKVRMVPSGALTILFSGGPVDYELGCNIAEFDFDLPTSIAAVFPLPGSPTSYIQDWTLLRSDQKTTCEGQHSLRDKYPTQRVCACQ